MRRGRACKRQRTIVTAKRLAFAAILTLAPGVLAPATAAQNSVIEQVRQSGVLVAGTRADSPPFGFIDKDGRLVGFSVDLLRDITAAISKAVKKPVRLDLKAVTPENRTQMIHDGTIQIECGITTATWDRLQKTDFSIPFFINGARILTHRRFGLAPEELTGKRIGVVAGGTTRLEVEAAVPKAEIIEVPDMSEGMKQFLAGKIDGLSNIGIVLRGLLEQSADKANLVMLPRAGAIAYEPLACMLPRDDSAWKGFVDRVISDDLRGAADYNGRYVELYNTWFGAGSQLPMPLDHTVIDRLIHAAYWID